MRRILFSACASSIVVIAAVLVAFLYVPPPQPTFADVECDCTNGANGTGGLWVFVSMHPNYTQVNPTAYPSSFSIYVDNLGNQDWFGWDYVYIPQLDDWATIAAGVLCDNGEWVVGFDVFMDTYHEYEHNGENSFCATIVGDVPTTGTGYVDVDAYTVNDDPRVFWHVRRVTVTPN